MDTHWYMVADLYLGKIVDIKGLELMMTPIIITSDHGENHGELNIYGITRQQII